MTDHRPPFDEFDLRHALTGQAATITSTADPSRLCDGMVRADRLRTVRAAATAGVMAVVVAFGVLNLQGVEERSLVDTVEQPDAILPEPTVPAIDDATSETAEDEPPGDSGDDEPQLVTIATTTAPPTTLPANPDHLTPPSTTEAPVAVVSTTIPPTTTVAVPTTTVPPTTTAAPTTTTVPPTTTTAPALFTAAARYGSCELDPPYDEYSGTATPGATVTITSPYSSATAVVADGNGDWAVTVFFLTAPANETFTVSVTDGSSVKTFDFVHVVV